MTRAASMQIALDGEAEFKRAVNEIGKSLKVLGSELNLATSGFGRNERSVASLTARNEVLNRTVDAQRSRVTALEGCLQNATQAYGENSEQAMRWATQLNNARAVVNNLEREIRQNEDAISDMSSGMGRASSDVRGFNSALNQGANNASSSGGKFAKLGGVLKGAGVAIGAAVVATGAAAAAGMKKAVDIGSEFEAQMSVVESISGASGEQMEVVEAKAKEMGKNTEFSATEAGKAFEYMAMAGWKVEEMMGGIEGVMSLASASGEDLASVSDIVTDAMTAFGLQANQSAHFSDVLAKAASSSNTNVEMLGESFKYVAPLAGTLGYSIEDTSVSLGLMANAGIKGSQAGTAMRAALSNMLKPTDPVAFAMKKLGLIVDGVNVAMVNGDGTTKRLSETIDILRSSFKGLTEAEQAEQAAAIFGREAMSGMLAIINASSDDYNNLTTQINNAQGASKEMAAIRLDNFNGQITLLKSSLEGLGLALYDGIKEPLKEFAKGGVQAVNELTTGFETGGVEGLVNAAGNVLDNLIAGFAQNAPKWISLASNMVGQLSNAIIQNIPTIATAAVQIVSQFSTFLLENLPLLITGAIELVIALANGIAQQLPTLVPVAVDAILTIAESLVDNIDLLVDSAIAIVVGLAEGIINALPKLLEKAPVIISKLVMALAENTPKLLTAAVKIIVSLAKYLIENLPQIVVAAAKIIGGIAQGLISYTGNLINSVKEIAQTIITAFSNIDWSTIGSNITRGIWNGITSLGDWLKTKVTNFANGILNAFTGKRALDINSPSKAAAKRVGAPIPKGVVVGMKGEEKKLEDAAKDLSGTLMDSFVDKPISLPLNIKNKLVGALDVALRPVDSFVANGDYAGQQRTFNVTIPLMLDGDIVSRAVSQVQWNRNKVAVRNLGYR